MRRAVLLALAAALVLAAPARGQSTITMSGSVVTRALVADLAYFYRHEVPDNRVPGITRAQIQDIVAGRVTAWSQIPGSPRRDAIVPVGREMTTASAQVFLSEFVDLTTPSVYRPVTLPTDAAVRDYIAQTPAAFGYVDLALTGPLHVLAYNGARCTRATIRAGTYPAARPLGVVTRGRPRGALARFLRWVGTSRTARRVIATRYP